MKAQLLILKDTKVPCINSNSSIVLYEDGYENPSVSNKCMLNEAKEYTEDELALLCRKYGARKITTYHIGEKTGQKENAPFIQSSKYYNGVLNSLIIKYKLTKSQTLLKEIGEQFFLIPVKTFNGNKKHYPSIKYSKATLKQNNRKCHVIFSDYEEYELWKEQTNQSWGLIQVTKYELRHINKNYNILINPCGNRLYIEGEKKKLFYYQMTSK